ncbi:hypothetical protein KIW84_070989 [Lathyrus oleraceus]|uniref:Ribonuclease II-like barrel domain-containing protein n=1 Tax=Pisum sativum TaxID=3888 RepID=A0A9D4VJD6_PEA|nr:hypothetical protein KIW84_070989 [Pisum sativum]
MRSKEYGIGSAFFFVLLCCLSHFGVCSAKVNFEASVNNTQPCKSSLFLHVKTSLLDMVVGDAAEGIALVHVAPCIGFVGKIEPMYRIGLAAGYGFVNCWFLSMYVVYSQLQLWFDSPHMMQSVQMAVRVLHDWELKAFQRHFEIVRYYYPWTGDKHAWKMNVLEDLEVEDEMALGSGVVQMVAEVSRLTTICQSDYVSRLVFWHSVWKTSLWIFCFDYRPVAVDLQLRMHLSVLGVMAEPGRIFCWFVMQESFLKAGGLKDLDFPLPFFFLGNGSTLRQTGGFLDQPQDGKTMEAVGDVGLLFTTGYSRIKMEHGRLWIVLAFVVVYLAGHVEVRLVGWELGRSILALQYCLQHSTRHDEICHAIPTAAVCSRPDGKKNWMVLDQNGVTSSIKRQQVTYIIPGISNFDQVEIAAFVQKA